MKTGGDSLFTESVQTSEEPLASRMRPRNIDEYIGQDHIMGPGRLLRRAIKADQLSSVIFSGPPGTGKTTLARVIANSTASEFLSLNAVLTGVADIRGAIEKAQNTKSLYGRRTILFVDEVHRWNKSQQDALLPWVENGTFILIGATTENPYFEVNAALVSRSRVFQLKHLNENDLRAIAAQALSDPIRGYGSYKVHFDDDALEHLVLTASGDARSLLNAMELAVETTPESWPPKAGTEIHINLGIAEESIQQKALLYDREGDYHFDSISAFIKSLRGSDPDAGLYWLARMVHAGESPRFIFRRMLILASEDVGLADPQAIVVVNACAEAFERVGLPEGQFFLSQAVLYLATAPKSNSTLAYFDAIKTLETEELAEVPNHLRDDNRDAKGFGHGEGYQYPHAFQNHWVAQTYLPASLRGKLFYQPNEEGYEAGIRELVMRRRETQIAEAKEAESVENLTWSPADDRLDHFLRRSETGENWLKTVRDLVFEELAPPRYARLAVSGPASCFLLPEALRRSPEGLVYMILPAHAQRERDETLHLVSQDSIARCRIVEPDGKALPEGPIEFAYLFEPPLEFKDPKGEGERGASDLLSDLQSRLAPGGKAVLATRVAANSPRLSSFLPSDALPETLALAVKKAEESLYSSMPGPDSLAAQVAAADWIVESKNTHEIPRNRTLHPAAMDSWFAIQREGSYGASLLSSLGPVDFERYKTAARVRLVGRPVNWPISLLVLRISVRA